MFKFIVHSTTVLCNIYSIELDPLQYKCVEIAMEREKWERVYMYVFRTPSINRQVVSYDQ